MAETSAHCGCDHEHQPTGGHAHSPWTITRRWILTLVLVGGLLMFLKGFIISQMLVRVTSYAANADYQDAARICRKILWIDPDNLKAWTSLGYAQMDLARPDLAISVFEQVLLLNPRDSGAASFELGLAHFAQGEWDKAIENFERVRRAGPRAGALLEADILKYRHGIQGFRDLNSMETLLQDLSLCYEKTGNAALAQEVRHQYDLYHSQRRKVLF